MAIKTVVGKGAGLRLTEIKAVSPAKSSILSLCPSILSPKLRTAHFSCSGQICRSLFEMENYRYPTACDHLELGTKYFYVRIQCILFKTLSWVYLYGGPRMESISVLFPM